MCPRGGARAGSDPRERECVRVTDFVEIRIVVDVVVSAGSYVKVVVRLAVTRRDTPREQSIQSSEGGRPSHEPRGRYLSHTRCAIGPGRPPGGKTREPN